MESPNEKKSLFKGKSTEKSKTSTLRSGRNARGITITKKDADSIPKENPLLSQAPQGSKTWNAFKTITKITQVNPKDYVPVKDDRKKSDYTNFRNW